MLSGKAARDMIYLKCELVSYAEDMCDYDSDSDDTNCKPQLVGRGADPSFNK